MRLCVAIRFFETLENLNWILVHRTFFFLFTSSLYLYVKCLLLWYALKIYHSPSFHPYPLIPTKKNTENSHHQRFRPLHSMWLLLLLPSLVVVFFSYSVVLECVSFMEFYCVLSFVQVTSFLGYACQMHIQTLHFRHLSTWIFAIETSNASVVLSFMKCAAVAAAVVVVV